MVCWLPLSCLGSGQRIGEKRKKKRRIKQAEWKTPKVTAQKTILSNNQEDEKRGENIKRFSQQHQPGQEMPDEGARFGWDSQIQSLKTEFCRTAFPADRDGHRKNRKASENGTSSTCLEAPSSGIQSALTGDPANFFNGSCSVSQESRYLGGPTDFKLSAHPWNDRDTRYPIKLLL